ncbi:helix-turn-helix transcriptional regulator [Brevundimonas sp. EAKA]|uniref:ArsR/SmtB family transcription factor n=1 Tax=Brevundimonas sp. EAKA TaxID=1495854 RepID=UPI001E499007|nr:metalloregulator ArsR/SmtB family transcription factor [Brevundimonas sp. EAKA]
MECKDAMTVKLSHALPQRVDDASAFLKGLANPHRLMILCALAQGERNVSALIAETGVAPASMSQHLSKLKDEGVVDCRRDHRTLTYFIAHPGTIQIMAVLYDHFCARDDA